MKIKLLFLFAVGFNLTVLSQTDLIWSSEIISDFNYSHSPSDYPKVIVENNVIKAFSLSDTNNDNKLQQVDYSLDGEILNSQFYGIDPAVNDRISNYKIDDFGNLYLIKNIFYSPDFVSTAIQKYDSSANLLWEDEIVSTGDFSYWGGNIEILNNNQLFLALDKEEISTQTRSQMMVSYDSDGNSLWQMDMPEIEFYTSNITAYNNNVIVFGFNEYPFHSMITVEADGTKSVIGNIEFDHGLKHILVDENLDIFATHSSLYWLTKLNGSGEVIWSTLYDDLELGMGLERINAFIKDDQGNIYVTGQFPGGDTGDPNDIYLDFLTLKLNSDGEILWENRYHRSIDSGEQAYDLKLKNGYIYVCGQSGHNGIGTDHDFVVIKMNASTGEETTQYRYDNDGNEDCLYSMEVLDSDEIVITGFSSEEFGSSVNLITQKLSGVTGTLSNIESKKDIISLYPNPLTTNEVLKIQNNQFSHYSIVTMNGLEIQNGALKIGVHSEIQLNNLSAGLYILVLKNETETINKKLILY